MDYIELGPTPAGENCAQLGTDDYQRRARLETSVYKRQLQRMFPDVKGYFKTKAFQHDFGTYYEVCFVGDDAEMTYVECNTPEFWDEAAKKELAEYKD